MTERFDLSDPEQHAAGLAAAAEAISKGELIVMPTDTVYGVGADAFTPWAVSRLLAAKGRGRDMPPPVLVGTVRAATALVDDFGAFGQDLIDEFWPGGLTLVARATPTLAWDLGDTRGTVAVRMPLHAAALDLLKKTGPMAVSSANTTGRPAATTADEAMEQLGDSVSVYLDGGPCGGGVASTIIDLTGSVPRLLRAGAISMDRLREVASLITGEEVSPPGDDGDAGVPDTTPDGSSVTSDAADSSGTPDGRLDTPPDIPSASPADARAEALSASATATTATPATPDPAAPASTVPATAESAAPATPPDSPVTRSAIPTTPPDPAGTSATSDSATTSAQPSSADTSAPTDAAGSAAAEAPAERLMEAAGTGQLAADDPGAPVTSENADAEPSAPAAPITSDAAPAARTRKAATTGKASARKTPAARQQAAARKAAAAATAVSEDAAESPAAESPAAESLAAEGPASESPASESPASESPASESPASESPADQPASEPDSQPSSTARKTATTRKPVAARAPRKPAAERATRKPATERTTTRRTATRKAPAASEAEPAVDDSAVAARDAESGGPA